MLDNVVDITKNSTTINEDIKLSIRNICFSGIEQTVFDWTYTTKGVDYTWLVLTFDTKGNFISMTDTRVLYAIGDTSINISYDQAITIAMENLQSYSYKMSDGSVVKDFQVIDVAAMIYTIPLDYVNYELRPYWSVKLFLDDVYPGSVFGVTVFLWANTGEVISISNMASGGIDYSNDNNSTSPDNTLVFALAALQ